MGKISRKTKILGFVFVTGLLTGTFFTNCAKSGFVGVEPGKDGTDPFLDMAWHLSNTAQKVFSSKTGLVGNDLNLLKTWTSGISGKGIKILISDDGVEDTHEDLKGNYLYTNVSKDYTKSYPYLANTSAPRSKDDNHGTAVAGLIAAVGGNAVGTKGVAFGASIVAANFLSSSVIQTTANLTDQASGDFDIFNMSWGSTQNTLTANVSIFHDQMKYGVNNGRSGKGSIYVKAAGNDFSVHCNGSTSDFCVGNSNFDGDNITPYTIMTAALNSQGYAASYSSPGANIWVSSFGGQFGSDGPAMITTDRMGCKNGFAVTDMGGSVDFERGGAGNAGCNYTATFNGTSAAAPVLSGAIALFLQANPNLTWRDVKYILAKTATPVDYALNASYKNPYATSPSDYVWEQGWVQNGAGFKFHNWYGFGRVNVDAAVAMAKSYTTPFGPLYETNWAHDSGGLSLAIPDYSATGVSNSMYVNDNMKIETVQLKIWVTHPNIANLAIELTSPSQTKSIVINMNNSLQNIGNYTGQIFLTNAFYQERAQGNWTLKVIDGKTGHTGTLTRWSLNFIGGL